MLKKLINDPFDAVDEMLEGFVAAHASIVELAGPRVVARRQRTTPKVALVIGGGSGHEPAFLGYVGQGVADAAAIGNVFAAPGADVCLEAIKAASTGRGVLLAYGNYAGDVLNFDLGSELAGLEGIACRTVRGTDDVASAPSHDRGHRRGIAGMFFLFKVAGAAAERGDDLEAVVALAERANEMTASIGVALAPCEVPGAGRPTFELGPDDIEIGMGIHGEPGLQRGRIEPADAVVDRMLEAIFADQATRGLPPGEVALLVNGLGATAYLDLYIVFRAAR
ncbi:MAG TPA: dihydroxyacetone kinase subunit DhaK, partial [Candidatus Limnocylindrales bacterium]